MVGTKNNRRAQATESQLKAALVQLLATQPLAKITVSAICRQADVNRGTFYTHYATPTELFQAIERDLVGKVAALIDVGQDMTSWLTQILELLRQNDTATEIIIRNLADSPLLQAVLLPIREETMRHYQQCFHETEPAMLSYYFDFFLSGAVHVITRWLKTGAKESPRAIAQVIASVAATTQAHC